MAGYFVAVGLGDPSGRVVASPLVARDALLRSVALHWSVLGQFLD